METMLKALSLVVSWGLPAVLVLGVAILVAAGAVLGLTGAVLRIAETLRGKHQTPVQGQAPAL